MSAGSVNALGAESKFISGTAFCASTGIAATTPATNMANRSRIVLFMPSAPTSARGRPRRRRLQHELLHSPRFDFAEDDLVGVAAVHHVDHLESRRDFAGLAELAEHCPIQLRLIDLAGDVPRPWRIAVRIRVGMEHELMWPR